MKKKILIIGLCGILLTLTACSKKEKVTTPTNKETNKPSTEEKSAYSSCAKKGQKCTEDEIKKGQLVKVELNEKESEEFYVINDDGENITLIMNGTYGIETAFVSSEDMKNVCEEEDGKSCGPYTAVKTINEATKNWTKIKNISNYTYDVDVDSDITAYKILKITDGETVITGHSGKEYKVPGETKARLVTAPEIQDLKDKDWLRAKVAELYDAKKTKHIYALTATPSYGGYDGTVKAITCKYNTKFTNINVDNELVAMPVIQISKSQIK